MVALGRGLEHLSNKGQRRDNVGFCVMGSYPLFAGIVETPYKELSLHKSRGLHLGDSTKKDHTKHIHMLLLDFLAFCELQLCCCYL